MYDKLHKDLSIKLSDVVSEFTRVDEVRNLYERQVEIYKEEMKRLDLKAEVNQREIDRQRYKARMAFEKLESKFIDKFDEMQRELNLTKDFQKGLD